MYFQTLRPRSWPGDMQTLLITLFWTYLNGNSLQYFSGETLDMYGVPVRCKAQSEAPQRCCKVSTDAQCNLACRGLKGS